MLRPEDEERQLTSGAGTGFTNIDRILGANRGAGTAISALANKTITDSNTKADEALSGMKSAAADTTLGPSINPGMISQMDEGQLGSYLKPKGVTARASFDAARAGLMSTIGNLSNTDAAGRELAKQGGITGGYNPRLGAIDSAIYGQDPQARAAAQAAKTDAEYAVGRQDSKRDTLESILGNIAAVDRNRVDANRKAIGDYKNWLKGTAGLQGAYDPNGPEAKQLSMIDRVLGTSTMPTMGAQSKGGEALPYQAPNPLTTALGNPSVGQLGVSTASTQLKQEGLAAEHGGKPEDYFYDSNTGQYINKNTGVKYTPKSRYTPVK